MAAPAVSDSLSLEKLLEARSRLFAFVIQAGIKKTGPCHDREIVSLFYGGLFDCMRRCLLSYEDCIHCPNAGGRRRGRR
jgi:hypothetical protein